MTITHVYSHSPPSSSTNITILNLDNCQPGSHSPALMPSLLGGKAYGDPPFPLCPFFVFHVDAGVIHTNFKSIVCALNSLLAPSHPQQCVHTPSPSYKGAPRDLGPTATEPLHQAIPSVCRTWRDWSRMEHCQCSEPPPPFQSFLVSYGSFNPCHRSSGLSNQS